MTCLILNTDASPVSVLPLSVVCWEEAIRYLVSDKATVLEWYDDWVVRSERWETRVPAILMLKEFQKKKNAVRFSKQNVFLRDNYTCQYCGCAVTAKTATLDHVVPVSHGGQTTWENSTTACAPCNSSKGNNKRILPKIRPYKPNYFQLAERRKSMSWDYQHPSWEYYIG